MSVKVMDDVWRYSRRGGIDLLVLLALADNASEEDRSCWPGVGYLARKARVDAKTVRRALLRMEGEEISIERREGATNLYKIAVFEGQRDLLRGDTPTLGDSHTGEGNTPTAGGDEPSGNRHLSLVGEEESRGAGGHALALAHARGPRTVARKRVTASELDLALGVLAAWNEATGSNLSSDDWLVKIIGRIREHPDLDLAAHQHVIAATLANPWWDGPASPSVAYGNGAQFERSMQVAQNGNGGGKKRRRFGLGVSTGELSDLAAQLRSEGR